MGYHIILALIEEQGCFFGFVHYDEQKFTLGGESLDAQFTHCQL